MADNLTKAQRSTLMSSIRGRNNTPEIRVKSILKGLHFMYQPMGIYGRPDFANKKRRVAIFIDGCFWHGCKKHFKQPTSNVGFWRRKLARNMQRDKKVTRTLRKEGWTVVRVWEHDVMKNPARLPRLFQEITNE